MINPDWATWIQRAVVKNFKLLLAGHPVFAETEDVDKNKLDHWYEVRVDISYTHLQNTTYHADIDVDILIMSNKKKNIYNAKTLSGLAASAFGSITVYNDSNVYQYCLRLNSKVVDTYYGEVEAGSNIEQATVEGSFETLIL